jgi:positive regulator of sigma E activity
MAVNRAGAKAGDRVVLEPAERSRAWSNLLVFGVPACLMLAGVLVGGLVMRRDLWAGVLSGAGLVVGWLIVKLVDRSVSRSGRVLPVIVRLADSTEDKGDDDEMVDRDAGCGDGR